MACVNCTEATVMTVRKEKNRLDISILSQNICHDGIYLMATFIYLSN